MSGMFPVIISMYIYRTEDCQCVTSHLAQPSLRASYYTSGLISVLPSQIEWLDYKLMSQRWGHWGLKVNPDKYAEGNRLYTRG